MFNMSEKTTLDNFNHKKILISFDSVYMTTIDKAEASLHTAHRNHIMICIAINTILCAHGTFQH